MNIECRQLCHHCLQVEDLETSIQFYVNYFGMRVAARRAEGDRRHVWLELGRDDGRNPSSLPVYPSCQLHLFSDPARPFDNAPLLDGRQNGYWKIAIAVEDLAVAWTRLSSLGLEVSEPFQVPDVAYLCHCEDPDGYCIELIQHRFEHNHHSLPADPDRHLRTAAVFSLITYRVRDPEISLAFYRDRLGMKLLSKQVVVGRGFTLYFLSCDEETPPTDNVEDIPLREWLWQRPYALIELQHQHGSEQSPGFAYRCDAGTGFDQVRLLAPEDAEPPADHYVNALFDRPAIELVDPDGYRIEILFER